MSLEGLSLEKGEGLPEEEKDFCAVDIGREQKAKGAKARGEEPKEHGAKAVAREKNLI